MPEPIPAKFWKTVTPDEFKDVISNGGKIEGELLLRLWRMWERQGSPPRSVTVLLESAAVDKFTQDLKGKQKDA
jgi:hypothetical protein